MYLLLGQLEMRNQDSAKAEAAFQKATELDPNNMNAFLMLASAQISRGSVDQAIEAYHRAIAANPNDVRIYVALGSLLETRNQWQEAEDLLPEGSSDSSRLCPGSQQSLVSYARTWR